jgi:hypothetical protein
MPQVTPMFITGGNVLVRMQALFRFTASEALAKRSGSKDS